MNSYFEQKSIQQAMDSVLEKSASVQNCPYRLGYHFMAPAYWINDPNGFIHFKEEYHLFYQHHPYSPDWGPMHWGHAKSNDLIHWTHLPIALAPTEFYESDGCFSGSAVNNDSKLTLIYTGHVKTEEKQTQVQCIAESMDTISFSKSENNPVIEFPPKEGSDDFRDPKVWNHNNRWYMVVGSTKDGVGKVLLYKSVDLYEWEYIGVVAETEEKDEFMWECPDLFPLGNKYILIVSPMDKTKTKRKNIYFIGEFNYETGEFTSEVRGFLDKGFDYYAAQTTEDDEGRRIAIAWMDNWDSSMPTKQNDWAGAMSIPRVLSLSSEGHLNINPIPEIKKLRKNHNHYQNIEVNSAHSRTKKRLNSECSEVDIIFDLKSTTADEFGIDFRCSKDGEEKTSLIIKLKDQEVILDRNLSGVIGDKGISIVTLKGEKKELRLHVFLDRSSIEVFMNGGKDVITNRIFPNPSNLGIELYTENGRVIVSSLDIWDLEPSII